MPNLIVARLAFKPFLFFSFASFTITHFLSSIDDVTALTGNASAACTHYLLPMNGVFLCVICDTDTFVTQVTYFLIMRNLISCA